jgi:hypothetical protein
MAEIVLGIGTSHGSMLSTPPEEWDGRARADRRNPALAYRGGIYTFDKLLELRAKESYGAQNTIEVRRERFARCQARLDALGETLRAAAPDVVLIVGDDQHEWFEAEAQPTFAVVCADKVTNYAVSAEDLAHHAAEGRGAAIAGMHPPADQDYPVARGLAERIVAQAMADGFDPTVCLAQPAGAGGPKNLGHAYGFVYRRLLGDRAVPLVPILVNTFYPPNQPSPARCFAFGRAIGRAIAAWSTDARVAVVGSGGLSHFVIDEDLDRRVLDAFLSGEKERIVGEPDEMFRSGTSETKNWIVAAGILADTGFRMTLHDYVPCYRSEAGTGNAMGFATWS